MSTERSLLAIVALTFTFFTLAQAQNCYYPNGDVATGDAPCSSEGGACCPFNWECMSNGLCYLPASDYYGRYTCTDQTWQSSSCPQICTEGNTATGNEALLQCSSGDWCCDGNRSWNCCTTADTSFFSLSNPLSIAFISSVASPTPASTVSNSPPSTSNAVPVAASASSSSAQDSSSSGQTTSSSDQSSTSAAASSSPTTSQQSASSTTSLTTMTSQSITTRTDGVVSTVTLISTTQTAAAVVTAASSNSSSSGHHHDNDSNSDTTTHSLGFILGLALGVPLFLLILGIALFILWRRRHKRHAGGSSGKEDPSRARSPPMQANYQPLTAGTHAPEIDGSPVANVGRSKSGRQSELEGSTPTADAMAAQHGGGGGAGWTSLAKKEAGLPGLAEEKEGMAGEGEGPQEMWAGYMPYRPPRAELQGSSV